MSRVTLRSPLLRFALVLLLAAAARPAGHPAAQTRQPAKQKIDEEYTAKIKEYTQDPRITTELVDHLPASDTVPSPLKFLGRMVGTPGELTYSKDIYRYYEALDKASDRITHVEDRQDRGRARHGDARRRRRSRRSSSSRSTRACSRR